MVYAIVQSPSRIYFLVTGTGEDSWEGYSYINANREEFLPLCSAPIIYKEVLYCVDCNGTLGTYDLQSDGDTWSVLKKPRKVFNDDMNPIFLVECGGDLLSVKLGHLGMPVRIFRLDLSEMEWVEVETLGKHMLFISKASCLSALAPDSRMENKIYFPRLCLNGEGILSYSLDTSSYCSSGQNQHFPSNFYETEGWFSNCTWIQPNWSKSTAHELDWLRD
ncbi:hypothetical protein MKW98_007444 [Papaver atlanticum]|uniref:KIB1-4 beta-propeller domain-containing protein n=1 Tax=Papaver atlanticum TaxID=357466 RepID=A0AAD4SD86_9MAGN|nr:hypothetical protein MKW98_007444 [Papaver atlanticum]